MHDFERVLLKPFIEPFERNTQRTRRNLIVTSVIAFFFSIGSKGIDLGSSSFAGIKFKDLQAEYIQLLLLVSLIYFLIHFIWAASDHYKENRLRLTGVAIPMARAGTYLSGNHTLEPNTSDAMQSTIYSWWKNHIQIIDRYENHLSSVEKDYNDKKYEPIINGIKSSIEEIQHKSSFIEGALLRYEKGFWHHQRSQLLRWLVLGFGMPVLIGGLSIFVTLKSLFL